MKSEYGGSGSVSPSSPSQSRTGAAGSAEWEGTPFSACLSSGEFNDMKYLHALHVSALATVTQDGVCGRQILVLSHSTAAAPPPHQARLSSRPALLLSSPLLFCLSGDFIL